MSIASGAGVTKAVARIALLGVDDASAAVLADTFRQFGIHASDVPPHESGKLVASYNACVVPLEGESEAVLRDIRRSSHRIVVYGTCGSIRSALRFAKWGINAVFYTPIGKQEALQVVRSTHLLVLKELRRYVRVPLVFPVTLETGAQVLEASSIEISAGGMSLSTKTPMKISQSVLASFGLPGAGLTAVRSVVCWNRDEEGTAAIRFDPGDARRTAVRQWIDDYLGG